jgi:hypothetical protein
MPNFKVDKKNKNELNIQAILVNPHALDRCNNKEYYVSKLKKTTIFT